MDSYKCNIIERMGGSSYFDVIVFQMCERILEDPRLKQYFGKCDIDDLFDMQRVLMDLAIRDFGDDAETKQKCYDRAVLQHYRLFQLGLDVHDFDILQSHLIASLESTWCDADVMEDLLDLFESLRTNFYLNGGNFTSRSVENDDDADHFELPLKMGKSKNLFKTKGLLPYNKGARAEHTRGNAVLKGIRQLSGENLLSMLKLNTTKRPKSSSTPTTPQ